MDRRGSPTLRAVAVANHQAVAVANHQADPDQTNIGVIIIESTFTQATIAMRIPSWHRTGVDSTQIRWLNEDLIVVLVVVGRRTHEKFGKSKGSSMLLEGQTECSVSVSWADSSGWPQEMSDFACAV